MDINILKEQEAATLREMIAASERIVVCCHKSPDGDAIGASLGWQKVLRCMGKDNVSVVIPDQMPDFLAWLPGTQEIVRYDKHPETAGQLLADADLIFCLDFNDVSRTEDMASALQGAPGCKIMIDHHLNPMMDVNLLVSRPEMSSTCELLFRITWQLGVFDNLDSKWAKCIYCGMMTDTGGFTYNSTDPAIYFIISQLLTKRIDKDKIYRNVFNNFSSWAIRFRGYVMSERLNVVEDLHAAFYSVTRKDQERFHFIKGDLEGLVNEPLRIKGLKLSISLREDTEKSNLVLVSLRSVGDFPCNKVAADFFNGGGHLNASGGKLHCSLRKAELVAVEAINAYADMLK